MESANEVVLLSRLWYHMVQLGVEGGELGAGCTGRIPLYAHTDNARLICALEIAPTLIFKGVFFVFYLRYAYAVK